jgi:hypothetical protein
MSKVIQFRSDLYYLDYYSKEENIPGMLQICVAFFWEVIWIDNLYYGTNPILDQSETNKKSPVVQSNHTSLEPS